MMKRLLLLSAFLFTLSLAACNTIASPDEPHSKQNESVSQNSIGVADNTSENTISTTDAPVKLLSSVALPNLPEEFIEFEKYIGQNISIFGVDTTEWDLSVAFFEIGKSSLYGNTGTASIRLGWDDSTITDITFNLDDTEYIQGEEYTEISNKLEELFGTPTRIADGITDYSGLKECSFRLLRNGAGISWNNEQKEAFNDSNPERVSETKPIITETPKKSPAIGMTAEQVRNSTWGEPYDINKTTYAWGVKEQWCNSNYRYIYLQDGIVTAISE